MYIPPIRLSEVSRRLANLEQAKRSADLSAVSDEAHALKGSASTFGAIRLSKIAQTIEFACKAGDKDVAEEQMPLLVAESAEAIAALHEFIAGLEQSSE